MKLLKILTCFSLLAVGSIFVNSPNAQANEWWTLYEVYGDDGTLYWADCMPVSGDCFVVTPEQ